MIWALFLVGCEDQMVYDIRIRRGQAEVEQVAEGIWEVECVGAAQCSDALVAELAEAEAKLRERGAAVAFAGYRVESDRLDLVVRYSIAVSALAEEGGFEVVRVQSPRDIKLGRLGQDSLAVWHERGSATTVQTWGPAARVSAEPGDGVFSKASTLLGGEAGPLEVDLLTRGRGRVRVVVPTLDDQGRPEKRTPWIGKHPGLVELLAAKNALD